MMETASAPHISKCIIGCKTPPDCITTISLPKPNQVGTVLLYGIPIVSLFIDQQERLCLAQISNTLLKQFSYNEIHNRRVALGITCIQCTPVQLEILRRAGAMPVSSRRCGMITRREAERLCKSFLGDNAPPRLPEDFAFSVHHECAWGCRGSFLPSRYNSSRAKCIKCSYCGLFFSPNKFIFHSHRVGPNNKYVQPDAANFNSWRRHMKLSGEPPEEIIHAWEDVKAMFNGGTRKRLITSSHDKTVNSSSPKRIKESHMSPSLQATAATAVVSVTAAAANGTEFPIRPVNLHQPASNANIDGKVGLGTPDIPLPFSRTLMMDYMWHAQTKSNSFQFSNYTFPWIKRPSALALNQSIGDMDNTCGAEKSSTNYEQISNCAAAAVATAGRIAMMSSNCFDPKLTAFCNNSAFKPVINSTRSFLPSNIALPVATAGGATNESRTISRPVREENSNSNSNSNIKESLSSDDEMVDIETTEEEETQVIDRNFARFRNSSSETPTVVDVNKAHSNVELIGIMKKEVFEHSSFNY